MAKKSFHWESEPEKTFMAGLRHYHADIIAGLQAICLKWQPVLETAMKNNAPWTDRTGNLRQSLLADVEMLVNGASLIIDYGLDYGVFLAYSNQGQFDIIRPTLDEYAPQIWADVKKMMS